MKAFRFALNQTRHLRHTRAPCMTCISCMVHSYGDDERLHYALPEPAAFLIFTMLLVNSPGFADRQYSGWPVSRSTEWELAVSFLGKQL